MKYLYIDTSSNYLYSAIFADNSLIAEIKEDYGQSLSEVALPKISSMFLDNNLNPNEIDKIIVVDGPGSFTGIRIGITIAKVYAWALNIPITTISSLEAMALSCSENCICVPIIDARRNYIYCAIYDENMKSIMNPCYVNMTVLTDKLKQIDNYKIISNDELNFSNIEKYVPNFEKIINYSKDKSNINPHSVNPNYLKLTEAEENKNDKRNS